MTLDRHLVVFAKAPRMGRVKSRLARDIGRTAAWGFYRRQLIETTRRLGPGNGWRPWLAVTPDRSIFHGHLWPEHWSRISQGQGDLGQRMAQAMVLLPPGPVVIIGTDIPGIRRHHIRQAFQRLGDHDAVFGPAADGGYWLIGLKRRPSLINAFIDVRWSSPDALADTEANLKACKIARLAELEDVDDGASYGRWRRQR